MAIETKIIIANPAILFIQYNLRRLTAARKNPTIEVSKSHHDEAPINTPKISSNCPTIPALGSTALKPAKNAMKIKTARGFEIVHKKVET